MMLMIIIHTLARIWQHRAWPLSTILLLFTLNEIEIVKYASASASAIAANNNNIRNDSRLFHMYVLL